MIDTEVVVIIDDEEVEVTDYDGSADQDWANASSIVQNDSAIPDELMLRAIQRSQWDEINSVLSRLEDYSSVPTSEMSDYISDFYTGDLAGLSDWLDNVSVASDAEDYFEQNKDWILESPKLTERYFDVDDFVKDLDMGGDVTLTSNGAVLSSSN